MTPKLLFLAARSTKLINFSTCLIIELIFQKKGKNLIQEDCYGRQKYNFFWTLMDCDGGY